MLKTSTDNGANWSGETTLFTPPAGAHDYRDPVIARTATGRIILNYFDYQGGSPEVDDLYVTYSDDGGVTWAAPFTVNRYSNSTCGSGTILPHSTGPILMSIYGVQPTFPPNLIGLVRSLDNGATWGSLISMGAGATPSGETAFVELPDGTVRAYTRQDAVSPGPIYQADSTDVGLTWGSWTALPWNTIPGRPFVCRFPDPSRSMVIWYRKTGTGGQVYRVSNNLGVTWGPETIVRNVSGMYSGGSMLTPKIMGVAYATENTINNTQVDFTTFTLS